MELPAEAPGSDSPPSGSQWRYRELSCCAHSLGGQFVQQPGRQLRAGACRIAGDPNSGKYAEAFRLAEPVPAGFTTYNGLSVGNRVEFTSARHAGQTGRIECFKIQTHRLSAMTEAIPYKTPVVFATVMVREAIGATGSYSISERAKNLRLAGGASVSLEAT